jgi:hypothetical protein
MRTFSAPTRAYRLPCHRCRGSAHPELRPPGPDDREDPSTHALGIALGPGAVQPDRSRGECHAVLADALGQRRVTEDVEDNASTRAVPDTRRRRAASSTSARRSATGSSGQASTSERAGSVTSRPRWTTHWGGSGRNRSRRCTRRSRLPPGGRTGRRSGGRDAGDRPVPRPPGPTCGSRRRPVPHDAERRGAGGGRPRAGRTSSRRGGTTGSAPGGRRTRRAPSQERAPGAPAGWRSRRSPPGPR